MALRATLVTNECNRGRRCATIQVRMLIAGIVVALLGAAAPAETDAPATDAPVSHEGEWDDEPIAPPPQAPPAPPPPAPPSDVQLSSGDLVRASMAADPELRRRWQRGSTLLGAGIPIVIVGSGLIVAGGVVGLVNAIDGDFTGLGLGLALGGFALTGGGGAMIGLGIRDRVAVKRASRRQLDLSFAPTRRGIGLGVRLRF